MLCSEGSEASAFSLRVFGRRASFRPGALKIVYIVYIINYNLYQILFSLGCTILLRMGIHNCFSGILRPIPRQRAAAPS